MLETVVIRPYCEEDLPALEALGTRVQPYRPEDEAGVEAMFARALQAEQAKDRRWMASPTLPLRPILEEFDAFWVAEYQGKTEKTMVGMVGGQTFLADEILSDSHSLKAEWQTYGRVAELRRLQVDPEMRRFGLGTRLCQTVIAWAKEQEYDILLVNTTTPQLPALQLYRKLGFCERGLSYIGRYEQTWLEMIIP